MFVVMVAFNRPVRSTVGPLFVNLALIMLVSAFALMDVAVASPLAAWLRRRLSVSGTLVYSTYLPRPVVALAVDSAGNAIVVDNLPLSAGRFSGPLGDV